ncbi:MAG: hypothetical protein II369_05380 [Clostridia bacterium]|nr:hypothetical protein [Clostridia bacterium]
MKKTKNIIWGIILIAVGLLWALDACGVIHFNPFFEGWWTFFLILPCGIGLITERDKTGNLIGLCIGVILLLGTRGIVDFSMIWKLLLPAIIVLIGVHLIFKSLFRKKEKNWIRFNRNTKGAREFCATFSGQNVSYDGMPFEGTELTAVFGGIRCDLRGAIIQHDVAIEVNSIFGGVDLFLPENVNIQVDSTSVFGGTSNKRGTAHIDGAVTIFVNSTCIFGGLDIK